MANRHYCGYCEAYHLVEVHWVTFYTNSNRIDTCFTCPRCKKQQVEKEFVRKEKTIQLVIPFPTPSQ